MQKGTDRSFRFVPFYFKSAALPKNFIAFFKQLIIIQNTLILCKNGQNRYPTLPKCFFLHKKKREIVLISLKFVVPLAGLEPARGLPRGILSPLRLPIPPQRHLFCIIIQFFTARGILSPLRLPIPPQRRY